MHYVFEASKPIRIPIDADSIMEAWEKFDELNDGKFTKVELIIMPNEEEN